MTLTVVMTDIHGCYDQMMQLMDDVHNFNDDPKKFIFLGDYVDRGPDSAKVVQYLIDHPEFICLKGNHEDMMINQYDFWLPNGGNTTLNSYKNVSIEKYNEHIEWMKNLPYYYEDEHRIYVHAGLDPRVPLEEQNAQSMLWIRDTFLLSNHDFGKLVIHGHTPRRQVDIQPNRINLDTGGVFGNKFTAAFFKEGQRDLYKYTDVYGYSKHVLPEDIIKNHPDKDQ